MDIISQFLISSSKISRCQICHQRTSIFENTFHGLICDQCFIDIKIINNKQLIFDDFKKYCPQLDNLYVNYLYVEPLVSMIRQYKYNNKIFWRKYFAKLMMRYASFANNFDVLLPVPLHQSKLRDRGFNHSWEIVKYLSAYTRIKCDKNVLIKNFATPSQVGSTFGERSIQQKGSFSVKKNNYQSVLVVDDIFTTGSTLNEISSVLRNSGVNKIAGWCLARVC